MPTVIGSDIILKASEYLGKPYRFGAKAARDDKDPDAFDCSGFVAFVCGELGVPMVDGSGAQYLFCSKHGKVIDIDTARQTTGSLVFRRNATSKLIEHIAFSDGAGCTIEARGIKYGVVRPSWRPGFTDAALIPAVFYPDKETPAKP